MVLHYYIALHSFTLWFTDHDGVLTKSGAEQMCDLVVEVEQGVFLTAGLLGTTLI